MNETMRCIRLYGELGARFGRVHYFVVGSAAEAVRAMCIMLPGFEKHLMQSGDRHVSYAVLYDTVCLEADALQMPPGTADIRIAPVLRGRKRGGLGTLFAAVALIALSVVTAGGFAAATAAMGTFSVAGVAMGMGVSLLLSGVAQMISPQPLGLGAGDRPDNGASYNTNGPVNTSAQGNCVPIIIGEVITGSATISGGIRAEDQT